MDEEFMMAIPEHREVINRLIEAGVIDHYAVTMETMQSWITFTASSKREVEQHLRSSPLFRYWQFVIEELFVVDGKVVAAMQREAAPGEFRANIHMGGTASVVKITSEEKKIAIKAAKAMNLKVAGVDIIRSSKGPLLLEVNSSPGLEGIEGATQKDIAGEMIKAIEKNFKWK
jgi:hypothetical protein